MYVFESGVKMSLQSENMLVSIIVPAYNVEKYIGKCVSSILEQTYKNIELIVVNDGSTDNTGNILENIKNQDNRIHVIHKSNAGVSAARNDGIDASKGDYIVFVDGDDYIASDFVEYMLSLTQNTDAEFCLSKNCYTRNREKQTKTENVEVLAPDDAIALLLSPVVIVGCWNKMFKRSLLENDKLRFSTSLFYGEGLHFIISAAQLSNQVGVGNRKVYYYRRDNEASATTKFNIEKLYNGEKSLRIIEEEFRGKSRKTDVMLTLHLSMFRLGGIVRLKANGMKGKYFSDYKRWLKYIRKNVFKLWGSREVSFYRKLLLTAGSISPSIITALDVKRRKSIANNSVQGE